MNVVICGIHYPVTAALEYLVRAFKRLGHNVFTVGAYNGLNIPWENGMVLSQNYDFRPDFVLPNQPAVPIKFVETKLPFEPDFWLDVNAGQWLSGRPKYGLRTTFLTDPHVLPHIYNTILGDYDFVYNPQKNYWLNCKNEYFVPYAADPEWHSPMSGVEKIYDVTLIGNVYHHRIELFDLLRMRGYTTYFGLGAAKEDARKIYNQSKFGVNWSSMNDITARVFELAAMGAVVPFYNRIPGLEEFFVNGIDYIEFDNTQDCVLKIKATFDVYDIQKEIANNARKKVIEKGHFWDDRARLMLEIAGVKNESVIQENTNNTNSIE